MPLEFVNSKIQLDHLKQLAAERFGDMVKAVVDVDKKVMVIGGQLHADEEAYLLQHDSKQENLWGINLYPNQTGENFIEYDSMINLRPAQGNMSRSVDDEKIRSQIKDIVYELCPR